MGETTRDMTGAPSVVTAILVRLLYDPGRQAANIATEIELIAAKHGDEVYVELLFLLAHLRFDPLTAREHWFRVKEFQDELSGKLGRAVDIRVALVDYFLHVNRQLENPKVIELRLFQKALASAYRDGLTGLYNYRYFREHLRREVERIDRYSDTLSLVMVDVDDFKIYNDLNGHECGNDALTEIAKLIQESVRSVDMVCRYGGEEFALILPSTPKDHALEVAERVRRRIEARDFPGGDLQPQRRLTVSLGVASYPSDGSVSDDLVRNADTALYVAKSRGKNIVHLAGGGRRTYRRVDAELVGSFRIMDGDARPLETLNLSQGGILFCTSHPVKMGALLELSLDLEDGSAPLKVAGRAVWVKEHEPTRYEVAIRTIDLTRPHRARILSFLRCRQ
jgi:diguanylate cyclase (GGDEF)-like protein